LDWIIPVSPQERAGRVLAPATAEAAYAALRTRGCALLRGVFPEPVIDALNREYRARYGGMDRPAMAAEAAKPAPNPFLEVGDARYDIAPRMDGVFAAPEIFANPLLLRFLTPLLGEDMRLSDFTIVVSHPGAEQQHTHRDHAHLFGDPTIGSYLPAYAINVAVPLIDVEIETGPTGIWPGSHLWPAHMTPKPDTITKLAFQRGDCVMMDYRTLHAGLANTSAIARPILYLVYVRTWFFDEVNFQRRASLNMTMETYQALPENIRLLLQRAFSQAMRARQLTDA
jgi:ectoine hydroxylase-related dioxygenase (phytanoyl-CoA dioxygenase family)